MAVKHTPVWSRWRARPPQVASATQPHATADIESQRAAYADLIRQHEAGLLRAAWRLCNGRQDLAQDLVQDTLVCGYEAFLEGRFQPGSNARAWFLRILTNRFLNDYRRQKWRSEIDVETLAAEGATNMQSASTERPETALLAATLEEPLEHALYSLSEELRVCVVLVEIEGFAYAAAAAILHIPIGTVRSRLWRARQLLHTLLYDYAQARRRV